MANNQQLLLGEGAGGGPANYIEDVFSTYLYTGNGSTQTITNGIDLSTKGGLVWIKSRTYGTNGDHVLTDTTRGRLSILRSNLTNAVTTSADTYNINSFGTTGFTLGDSWLGYTNSSGSNNVSWTFREQPKFFDVVTYTGNGAGAGQTINHNLGSIPGFIICKSTSTTGDWAVCARTGGASSPASSITYSTGLSLNSTGAALYSGTLGDFPTATTFSTAGIFDNPGNYPNVNGVTYVAYLFAHNAGGFGLAGTDNVISCGSYTGNATAGNAITLGYEPQWIMIKQAAGADAGTNSWSIYDNMRGMPNGSANDNRLEAENANAEVGYPEIAPTATGFICEATGGRLNASGGTYIYIAIRRGPMKVPTVGTSVFSPNAVAGYPSTVTTGFPVDLALFSWTSGGDGTAIDRLRGSSSTSSRTLKTFGTSAEVSVASYGLGLDSNVGYYNNYSDPNIWWNFRRAPGFFDEVCYTGTGSNTTFTHNLGTVPEVIIIKSRSGARNWNYLTTFGASTYTAAILNDTYAPGASPSAYDTLMQAQPTATQFSVSTAAASNNSGETYVAYLFATVAGVSKIGTYTGNGSSQTIACGFAAGSRFVLIKRISASGDWYVWDSARGIIAGNDPHLSLNTTAAEVTTDDSVDTDNSGFIVNQLAATNVNVTSATYIFLAIS